MRGVSEQYGDGTKGDRAVVTVTAATFKEVVMDEEKDVILLLHSQGCEGCAHLAVYYKVPNHLYRNLTLCIDSPCSTRYCSSSSRDVHHAVYPSIVT